MAHLLQGAVHSGESLPKVSACSWQHIEHPAEQMLHIGDGLFQKVHLHTSAFQYLHWDPKYIVGLHTARSQAD